MCDSVFRDDFTLNMFGENVGEVLREGLINDFMWSHKAEDSFFFLDLICGISWFSLLVPELCIVFKLIPVQHIEAFSASEISMNFCSDAVRCTGKYISLFFPWVPVCYLKSFLHENDNAETLQSMKLSFLVLISLCQPSNQNVSYSIFRELWPLMYALAIVTSNNG